jgi:small subunit ribosomal protein S15
MALTAENKSEIIKKYQSSDADTGSARVQVALITARLNYLQEHFEKFKKDHHSRRGLLKLVGRRRRLLDYIKAKDVKEYRELIGDLGIRK